MILSLIMLIYYSLVFNVADTFESTKDCKVLVSSIDDQYDGDCKKGKAEGMGTAKGEDTYQGEFKKGYPHGQGRYIWADGNFFSGEFKKGLKDGYGELVVKRPNQLDSIVVGYWKEDNYVGRYENAYDIGNNKNIRRVRINKVAETPNQVQVFVVTPEGFPIPLEAIEGRDQMNQKTAFTAEFMGWPQVAFPLSNARISYQFRSMDGIGIRDCFAEFSINSPGSWEVNIETEIR